STHQSVFCAIFAPAPPHQSIGSFHFAGKARRVTQWRSSHFRSQGAAQIDQPASVLGETNSNFDVAFGVFGNEFVEAYGGEQTGPNASGMAIAPDANDRYTHPQRFAGRRRAIVGKRIERDVDLVIVHEVSSAIADGSDERDPLGRDPALDQASAVAGPGRSV